MTKPCAEGKNAWSYAPAPIFDYGMLKGNGHYGLFSVTMLNFTYFSEEFPEFE